MKETEVSIGSSDRGKLGGGVSGEKKSWSFQGKQLIAYHWFLSAQSFSLRNKNIVWKNTAQEEEEVFKDRY